MSFSSFFRAAWNKEPFPWQERLAVLAMEGKWPGSIGLPTAAGKTALIDIAVYALAMGAPGAARRIFFVVDRRIVVDEAMERAADLARKLAEADPSSELGAISRALREIGDGEHAKRPLETAALRGGIPRNEVWTRSPRQPLVVCSTVDQLGSSLMFRAYDANPYNWPIRAALAAIDSIVILDEAHISQPFAQTLRSIQQYNKGWATESVGDGLTVVEMSATPRSAEVFREDTEDHANEVLGKRWTASKRTRLVEVGQQPEEENGKGDFDALIKALEKEARAMYENHGARVIGVIANRVGTARSIHAALASDERFEAILLTGRARAYDRDQLWRLWRPFIGLGRAEAHEKPIFVVATQCIEVGANIDFDALVTEAASIDALEQRFGRLNREGREVLSHAAIMAQKDQIGSRAEDPIYGKTLAATWRWLKSHVTSEVRIVTSPGEGKKKPKAKKEKLEFVEMGVLALRQSLEETPERETLTTSRPNSPVLMPAHMDLLCQTSPEPGICPEPAIFLHGPDTEPAEVQVVWRQDLDENCTEFWLDTVSICPPSAAESVSLPIWVARKWLCQAETTDVADIEGLPTETSRVDTKGRPALVWLGPDDSKVANDASKVRPGNVVVVPAAYGGCDKWGWNPDWTETVLDIGDPVKLQMGRPILRLHERLANSWKYPELARSLRSCASISEARDILAAFECIECDAWVVRMAKTLSTGLRTLIAKAQTATENTEELAAVAGRAVFEQEGVRSGYGDEVGLDSHLRGCEAWAGRFAVALPHHLQGAIRKAALFHDIGKADPRFQAWLRGGNPIKPRELLAKSGRSGLDWEAIERARQMAGYPKGGRHELLSVALWAHDTGRQLEIDRELVLHLIASHHGRCRPFAPVVLDTAPVDVQVGAWISNSDHGLERASSGITERFWKLTDRYGWYGLAYLEAILRLADHRRSEEEQKGIADE
jgi:CRISPR-associated endonuclease/helicase Cas3